VNSQDLQARLLIGNADFDLAIESAGAAQGGIENFGDICRADYDDLAAGYEAVHEAEELRYYSLFYFASDFGTLGSYRVDFVDEENCRGAVCGFFEDLAEFGFAFAVELPHDFRAVEVNEVDAAFGGYGAS
jgi:hypothetical protein